MKRQIKEFKKENVIIKLKPNCMKIQPSYYCNLTNTASK